MTTLNFSELNDEQKNGAVLQMFRFNRNFNFPHGVDYANEEVVKKDAEMGFLDEYFTFKVTDDNIQSFALISWETASPEHLNTIKALQNEQSN